jgi:hypothetical protein
MQYTDVTNEISLFNILLSEVKQVLSEGWYQWEGEDIRKGCRRVSIVEILRTHALKWNSETC